MTEYIGMPKTAVSIHAPYAGSDKFASTALIHVCVSIHAPYAGSDILSYDNAKS